MFITGIKLNTHDTTVRQDHVVPHHGRPKKLNRTTGGCNFWASPPCPLACEATPQSCLVWKIQIRCSIARNNIQKERKQTNKKNREKEKPKKTRDTLTPRRLRPLLGVGEFPRAQGALDLYNMLLSLS